jgi:hypothetical protein
MAFPVPGEAEGDDDAEEAQQADAAPVAALGDGLHGTS